MVNYRRARVPGATYFFTVTLRDRRSRMLTDHVDALREVVKCVRRRWPFRIDAVVVLPDHLHTIWTLPEGDADFSKRWRAMHPRRAMQAQSMGLAFKARFTRRLVMRGIALAHDRRGEYALWQRRFWERLIRDAQDFACHVDYNPVKHGWVARPLDWRWSSIHRYIRLELLPPDWAAVPEEGGFGE
ncbi:MAG: REP-associated tyrosine transposase [Gammaproteobacteria bacterium]